ncbi:MAG TPA: LpxL/LpxP family Kdo(2)-lipid IV(A) lauroyl/palmitoleoyl acyltransferase [Rhodanobacteraceae bacterium]|nr:LpxL/LpxP family Kdo(2)-lipid IV(A) lauroyl/palmitoleoyl acyltransferase [Rhodanobacteraceae bacterium]
MTGARVPPFPTALLHPRHWPAWAGLGATWLLGRLPQRLALAIGSGIGTVLAHIPGQRRQVAARNIALCLPELPATAQTAMVGENLRDAGRMLAEFALGWMANDRSIAGIPLQIDGLAHLQQLAAEGRGALLVGGHFSHLELCARLLSSRQPIAGMYREMDSAVFERAVLKARLHYARAMFTKTDLRGAVKFLKGGGALWYAPDQDMRGKDHVFVPFFGVPAATITATHHLARLSGAAVLPFAHRRLPAGGYRIDIGAPLTEFPSTNIEADTARVNAEIERMVRAAPSQYLWTHKRFKTRPPGAPPVY